MPHSAASTTATATSDPKSKADAEQPPTVPRKSGQARPDRRSTTNSGHPVPALQSTQTADPQRLMRNFPLLPLDPDSAPCAILAESISHFGGRCQGPFTVLLPDPAEGTKRLGDAVLEARDLDLDHGLGGADGADAGVVSLDGCDLFVLRRDASGNARRQAHAPAEHRYLRAVRLA